MNSPKSFNEILSPSRKSPLSDDIAAQLREAILSGLLQPGERLVEELLAASLDVSRGPIRDALVVLEREGLVIKEHNRGTFVARLSRKDLDEVYSLRLVLERLAIRLAAEHVTDAELQEMQHIIDLMRNHAEQGITEKLAAELDIQFHEIIYRASRHQRLFECWNQLKTQIYRLLLGRMVATLDYRTLAVESHQDILDAIAEKDTTRAVTLLEQHIDESYERVVDGYERTNGVTKPAQS